MVRADFQCVGQLQIDDDDDRDFHNLGHSADRSTKGKPQYNVGGDQRHHHEDPSGRRGVRDNDDPIEETPQKVEMHGDVFAKEKDLTNYTCDVNSGSLTMTTFD